MPDPPRNITPPVDVSPLPMVWPRQLTDVSGHFHSMAGGIAAAGYGASKFLMGWTGICSTYHSNGPLPRKFGKATLPDFIGDRFYSTMPDWLQLFVRFLSA